MIRDRGNIKWTAMMLPEHVKELREWIEEDNYAEKPELTEWDFQVIQEDLEIAYKRKCETLVKTWKNGRIIHHQGVIEEIDIQRRCIVLEDPFGFDALAVEEIISVQSIE